MYFNTRTHQAYHSHTFYAKIVYWPFNQLVPLVDHPHWSKLWSASFLLKRAAVLSVNSSVLVHFLIGTVMTGFSHTLPLRTPEHSSSLTMKHWFIMYEREKKWWCLLEFDWQLLFIELIISTPRRKLYNSSWVNLSNNVYTVKQING